MTMKTNLLGPDVTSRVLKQLVHAEQSIHFFYPDSLGSGIWKPIGRFRVKENEKWGLQANL